MEKLIMLIDIYEEEVVGVHSVGDKITDKDEARIISKQFGFIKRLVDSDKIDRAFIKDVRYPYYLEKGGLLQGYEESDSLIMILAIQDEPVKFLSEILKDE